MGSSDKTHATVFEEDLMDSILGHITTPFTEAENVVVIPPEPTPPVAAPVEKQ